MARDKEKSNKAFSGTITPNTTPLSAAEILNQGEQASKLLNAPVYNLAHRSVIQNLQNEWMTTQPHEREKREGLYQMIRGLSAVSAEMAMMIEQARLLGDDELAQERKLQLAYDENAGFGNV